MHTGRWSGLVLVSCLGLFSQSSQLQAAELTEAEFRTLHAELQQEVNAPWRSIPWKISLLEAQAAAAEQQKPIFIWAMDGHPLGCT